MSALWNQLMDFLLPRPALRVDVVLVSRDRNLNRLPGISAAILKSRDFWASAGVKVEYTLKALESELPPHTLFFGPLSQAHYWTVRAVTPAVYIFGDYARVGGAEYLGLAFGNGVAAVAGLDVGRPGGGSILDEIMDHELGHLLGLGHEEGTFMRAELEVENRRITTKQRVTLCQRASQWFGE